MSPHSRSGVVIVVAMLLFSTIIWRPTIVRAATFNVDTTLDLAHTQPLDGTCSPCSLRSAIQAVGYLTQNGDPGPHTINLPGGTYTLTLSVPNGGGPLQLPFTGSVIISGGGSSSTIVDGNALNGVFYNPGSTATISNLTIRNGNANGTGGIFFGGGVDNTGGAMTLDHVIVTNNTAVSRGGGLSNTNGTMTVQNSMVIGNQGNSAGIFHFSTTSSTLNLDSTTVANNTATGSAIGVDIVAQTGPAFANITNSTITGHDESIRNGGTLTLVSSTVSGTTRALSITGSATLQNSILARTDGFLGCTGGATVAGRMLITGENPNSPSCGWRPLIDLTGDPRLAALADNGGPTLTQALLAGSPALGTALNCPPPATDQRGVTRPQGGGCDLGAFESSLPAMTPTPTLTVTPTVSPTTPPTSTPIATQTPTSTPFPRPNVGVQVTPAPTGGQAQVTLTARNAGCAGGNNQLQALRFTRLTNATVDVPGVGTITAPSATPIALASHPASIVLTLHRVTNGTAATAELTVTDGCGDWPTFVGGGPGAF